MTVKTSGTTSRPKSENLVGIAIGIDHKLIDLRFNTRDHVGKNFFSSQREKCFLAALPCAAIARPQ